MSPSTLQISKDQLTCQGAEGMEREGREGRFPLVTTDPQF